MKTSSSFHKRRDRAVPLERKWRRDSNSFEVGLIGGELIVDSADMTITAMLTRPPVLVLGTLEYARETKRLERLLADNDIIASEKNIAIDSFRFDYMPGAVVT